MVNVDETIAALASPAGGGLRTIIRVSGPASREAVGAVFRPNDPVLWEGSRRGRRHSGFLQLADWPSSLTIAAYQWPTARSYTGQPMVELHLPGSPMLAEGVLETLYRGGVRPARPGEFTLRAFLAGRLDLVQAEAVLGVIDADDHEELQLALRQLAGGLSGRVNEVRGELLSLLADLEAGLDFVEEDIEFVSREDVLDRVRQARETLDRLLSDATSRWREEPTWRIVLAGLPNAGKSTLFNALTETENALVSPIAGTTRDWLTATVHWPGAVAELVDTAGWEVPRDELTQAMHDLRARQIERADLVLWCTPSDLDAEAEATDARLRGELTESGRSMLRVMTKADLPMSPVIARTRLARDLPVCSSSIESLSDFREQVIAAIQADAGQSRHMLGSTAARARESLAAARDALVRLEEASELGFGDEILSAELRAALDGLAAVVGAIYTDDLLDVIFSRFCIGK